MVVLIIFQQQNNYIINIEVIINENIGIIDEKNEKMWICYNWYT